MESSDRKSSLERICVSDFVWRNELSRICAPLFEVAMPKEHRTEQSAESLRKWLESTDTLSTGAWPRLWWNGNDAAALRERALAVDGFPDRMGSTSEGLLNDPVLFVDEPAWHHSQQAPLIQLASAAWLLDDPRLVSMTTRLLDRAASAETWVASEHQSMPCDYCVANVGATFAIVHDLLADRLTDEQVSRYGGAVREKCLDPFLVVCRDRSENWAQRDCTNSWRIMTCGDTGLAVLGSNASGDDLPELLAYAIEGVIDILDTIPEDGAFIEEPHSFVAKISVGLRFFEALRQRGVDSEQWLNHPKLKSVTDYILHLSEPDGGTFDNIDNTLVWSPTERATMLLLASHQSRVDLASLARRGDVETVMQVVWDTGSPS
jgi:hypothetical protein